MKSLLDYYKDLNRRQPSTEAPQFGPLVYANGNEKCAYHSWFRMKESFSNQLVIKLLEHLKVDIGEDFFITDPFSGSGTALLSGLEVGSHHDSNVSVLGVETNPFLHLLSSTKLNAFVAPPEDYYDYANAVVRQALREPVVDLRLSLSTLSNETYVPASSLTTLLSIREAIRQVPGSQLHRDLARVCLASSVEPSTRLRKDGRALRFVPEKVILNPLHTFLQKSLAVQCDLDCTPAKRSHIAQMVSGDIRDDMISLPAGVSDFSVFSPPYPNNIDYTEVYKLEAWVLGLFNHPDEFREQRSRTIHSHPSCRMSGVGLSQPVATYVEELVAPLLEAIPKDKDGRWRRRMIQGYFKDMAIVFMKMHPHMKSGSYVVYIVGNSLHGKPGSYFLVATDVLLANIAQRCGFNVLRLLVARRPARRSNESMLRESVVILQRP